MLLENNGFTLEVDPGAQERIAEVLAEHGAQALRVYVQGGDCSGFSYQFDLAHELQADDFFLQSEDGHVALAVDSASVMYLGGATLRFLDGLWERRFVLDNPNARQTCGCGSSFAPAL